jgi:hypothetical protein
MMAEDAYEYCLCGFLCLAASIHAPSGNAIIARATFEFRMPAKNHPVAGSHPQSPLLIGAARRQPMGMFREFAHTNHRCCSSLLNLQCRLA